VEGYDDVNPVLECFDWSAWYNEMPPDPPPDLHVTGTCKTRSTGVTLTLELGDVGVVPEPDLIALVLKAEASDGGGDAITEQTVSWEGDVGPDIKRVRIQGAAEAEIEVEIAS
jgi:hypothetical protein